MDYVYIDGIIQGEVVVGLNDTVPQRPEISRVSVFLEEETVRRWGGRVDGNSRSSELDREEPYQ